MKTLFVEQAYKHSIAKSIFKKVEQKDDRIIIYTDLSKTKFETKIKISKKIRAILTKEKSRQIILESKLKQDQEFVNLLYSNNINICSSKWLFKNLVNEIIEDILKGKNKQESEIWICVNEVDSLIEEYIYKFAKEFKRLTIITNHIGKFKKIEEKLYEEDGIMLNVTNNKRKSLLKANLILNFDFPKELLNQFTIFDNATIINLDGDMKIRKKRFCGKIINDFEIEIDEKEDILNFVKENSLENYDIKDISQAIGKIPEGKIHIV